jgi:hypothetical protein
MNDNTFWLSFWSVLIISVSTTIIMSVYFSYNHDIELVKAGYEQKLIITRPATEYLSANTEKVWARSDSKNEPVEIVNATGR